MNIPTTPQEIFDFTTRKIIEQGGPSRGPNGCLYRGPFGRKCAIGWLIPDNECPTNIEAVGVVALVIRDWPTLLPRQIPSGFYSGLQDAHDFAGPDMSTFWGEWKDSLGKLAEAYHLSPAVLSEIPEDAP